MILKDFSFVTILLCSSFVQITLLFFCLGLSQSNRREKVFNMELI